MVSLMKLLEIELALSSNIGDRRLGVVPDLLEKASVWQHFNIVRWIKGVGEFRHRPLFSLTDQFSVPGPNCVLWYLMAWKRNTPVSAFNMKQLGILTRVETFYSPCSNM